MAGVVGEDVQGRWKELGYEFRPFQVLKTSRVFEYSRQALTTSCFSSTSPTPERVPGTAAAPIPSNLSTLVNPHKQEILINGVLQGRKQDDPRGASSASRRRMWGAVRDVYDTLGLESGFGEEKTYVEMKAQRVLEKREKVKKDVRALALRGWRRNEGDEGWVLDGEEKEV